MDNGTSSKQKAHVSFLNPVIQNKPDAVLSGYDLATKIAPDWYKGTAIIIMIVEPNVSYIDFSLSVVYLGCCKS